MKFRFYYILSATLILGSCDKEVAVIETPDFEVTTSSSTYKAGEEVKFNFSGNAHNISFYSGEVLHDYAFKDGRTIDVKGAGATMEFTSSVQTGAQANQLSVLASTDFNGDYSSLAKVKAATWTDITNRFVLGTGTAFQASGTKDISDLIVPGKPIYIAFKYITKPQAANGLARQWFIQAFAVNSKAMLNSTIPLTVATQPDAGFRIIDENGAKVPVPFVPYDGAPARSSITSTRVTLYGNQYLTATLTIFDPANPIFDPLNPIYNPQSSSYSPTAIMPPFVPYDLASPLNDPLSENWAVSKAINVELIDLGPDRPVSLKGLKSTKLSEFRYIYTNPGSYKAVFVASNNSINNVKKVFNEITLMITP